MSILPHTSDQSPARTPVRDGADLLARESVGLDERFAGIDSTLDVFRLAAAAWPDRPALTFVPDGSAEAAPVDVSYARLHERIVRTANHLASLGLRRDDCVAYLLPNLPEAHFCIWGAQAVCRVAAVNHFLEPAQIADLLHAMDARVVVTASPAEAPELWAKLGPVLAGLPGLRETLWVGAADPAALAACFHTGGTTGTPKIAQLSHRVLLAGRDGFRNPKLVAGFWRLVERFRVTTFSGVPTVYAALLNVPLAGADVSSLRFGICGAAPMPVELFRRFESATGIRLLEGFGMTETTACASVNPRDGERRVGSIGLPVPYGRMKTVILDERGAFVRDAATDEIGVVAILGPHLTPGYRDPRHDAGLWLPGGWLNSGDLGRRDADGYFWLVGRAKDLIIRGGHNIDPSMIEEALARHPEVELVAAVGRPDAYAGELPVAYVKLRHGARADAEELKAFAKAHVTERAAAPSWVECIDTMPVTAVGKIFKPTLRKHAIARTLRGLFAEGDLQHADIEVRDDRTHGVVAVVGVADEAARARVAELCAGLALQVRSTVG